MTKPFFSILVPTYNQDQYLGEALDSLIFQTDPDWEAIIVNDGSTDNTAKILEDYTQKDPRFRVFHKTNGGVGSALNVALENAHGRWICWLSSDDVFEVNKLAIHRQWINEYPEYKFFFSNFRQLVGKSGKVVNLDPTLSKNIPSIKLQVLEMFNRNYIAGNSICISREAWLQVGNFNENLRYAQDYDMWLRLLIHYPAFYIPEFTYLQRIYPEQESNKFSDYCYFDSARSSINILNYYKFEDLFSRITNDLITDKKLNKSFFKILFNVNAFTYYMGVHPLLFFRFIEWFSCIKHNEKNNFKSYLINQIESQIKLNASTPLEFWYEVSKSILNQKIKFNYSGLEPEHIAENYYSLLDDIDEDLDIAVSLKNYSSKFLDLDLPASSFEASFKYLLNTSLTNLNDQFFKDHLQTLSISKLKLDKYKYKIFILENLYFLPISKIYVFLRKKKNIAEVFVDILFIIVRRSWLYSIQGIFLQKTCLFMRHLYFYLIKD